MRPALVKQGSNASIYSGMLIDACRQAKDLG